LSSFAGAVTRKKFLPAKHYHSVMISCVAVDYRGFIKVDEVDGRSPVERAAAAFVLCTPTCVDNVLRNSSTARQSFKGSVF